MHPACPLPFEAWLAANEEELTIRAAELGADREPDFDSERFAEREYSNYLQKFGR